MEEIEESFEESFKRLTEEGYLTPYGEPTKCECGCTEFKQVNQYYGEGYIEEYQLECTNQECLKIVGTWSYGNWML